MSSTILTVASLFYHIIVYPFARLVGWIVRLWARWEVRGAENVPKEGSLLVVANHMHLIDVLILAVSLGRKATFMAKEELFRSRLQAYMMYSLGTFPVQRGRMDLPAMRKAKQVLDNGGVLIMFPEGKRSDNASLQQGKQGSVTVALRSGAPVLPVGIYGTEKVKGIASVLHRPRVVVNIGRPFYLLSDNNNNKSTKDKRAEFIDVIMRHIAELLPPEYHGVYNSDKVQHEN